MFEIETSVGECFGIGVNETASGFILLLRAFISSCSFSVDKAAVD